jgi:uncharacterized protein
MLSNVMRAALWLCLVSLGIGFAPAERVEDLPRPTNYVSDFAGVLSPQAQQQLNALCSQVDHQARAQIAVVTIKSLDDVPIEDFVTALEDKWKVGRKGTDRGVLVFFAVNDHKRRIEVGYGLEGILPDGKAGDIGRTMVPLLRNNDYDQAVLLGVSQVAQVIAADAGVTLQNAPHRGPPRVQPVRISFGRIIFFGIILLLFLVFAGRAGGSGILGFLLGMFLGGGGRGGWGGGGSGGWGGGGGGGDGGGDSGFGGFGGGSSGGGGASGDW